MDEGDEREERGDIMPTIRIKRLISTAPYENVEFELTEKVPRDEMLSVRDDMVKQIDDFERLARKHYLPTKDNRIYQSNRTPQKSAPTAVAQGGDRRGPRADPETVEWYTKIKKNVSPLNITRLNKLAKSHGLPDATFWPVEKAKEMLDKITGAR